MTDLDPRKHGIGQSELAVRPEEVADFNYFLAGLVADLRPSGELQRRLFGKVLHASWNMRLARQKEAQLLLASMGPVNPDMRAVTRFYQACDREFFKALSELRNLQSELAYRATLSSGQQVAMPDLPPLVQTSVVHRQVRTATGARMAFREAHMLKRSGG